MVVDLDVGGILQIYERQVASHLPRLQLHNVVRFLIAEQHQLDSVDLDNHNNLTIKNKFVVELVHPVEIGDGVGVDGVGEVDLEAGEKAEDVVDNCVLVYGIVELGQRRER